LFFLSVTFSVSPAPFGASPIKQPNFFRHFRKGTTLANSLDNNIGQRDEVGPK